MSTGFDDAVPLCNCALVRRAARQLSRFYDTCLADSGLRSTQFTVLAHVKRSGPLPIGDLAARLAADRATMGHNLRPLERDGLIRLMRSSADRRVREVVITTAGAKALASCEADWRRAQRIFEDGFGAAQARTMRRLMTRLFESGLGTEVPSSAPGPSPKSQRSKKARSPDR